jgi:hypothetical protein
MDGNKKNSYYCFRITGTFNKYYLYVCSREQHLPYQHQRDSNTRRRGLHE